MKGNPIVSFVQITWKSFARLHKRTMAILSSRHRNGVVCDVDSLIRSSKNGRARAIAAANYALEDSQREEYNLEISKRQTEREWERERERSKHTHHTHTQKQY